MEISQLETREAHEAGTKCNLVQADGSVSDAFVIVQGPDSADFRLAKRNQRKMIIELKAKNEAMEAFDFFPLDVEFAIDLITDWGNITKDGEPLKFSKKACKGLLENSPVNVDRILDHCGDRVNFTKG